MLKRSLLSASVAAIALPFAAFAQTAQDQPTTSQDRTYDNRSMTGQDRTGTTGTTGQDRTGTGAAGTAGQDPYGTSGTTGQDMNRTEPAAGQDTMRGQTNRTMQTRPVDVKVIATGYRASELMGRDIVNEANETVGTIDDLVVTRDDRVLYAIVSVGGFLGMGERLVAVPYDELTARKDQFVMRDATKESLKKRPEFKYQN